MARANPNATTYSAPNPVSMFFHMFKTFSLTGSVLGDARVHPVRKMAFVTVLGTLILAALGVEGAAELVTQVLNVIPGLGLVIGAGEVPVDFVVDWTLVTVAAFNLLRLFPADIVGEHYDRLFRARRRP